jgi:hypothetical protein
VDSLSEKIYILRYDDASLAGSGGWFVRDVVEMYKVITIVMSIGNDNVGFQRW